MNVDAEKLYTELRKTKYELINKINDHTSSIRIKPILEDELKDINLTLQKIENGQYGKCEISGELIPEDLLAIVPTLKSIDDIASMGSYYRKSLFLGM